MSKEYILELSKPLYSTYHVQGAAGAVLHNNPSIYNWYYNEVANLSCTKRFLDGYSSPELAVPMSAWYENPYLGQQWFAMKELNQKTNRIIQDLITRGYYVYFFGIDDYYMKGKSWYQKRHYNHDGLIHGYSQNDSTFYIYAYDEQFVYRSFKTGQDDYRKAMISMFEQEMYGHICGIKPKSDRVYINPRRVYESVKDYIDCVIPDGVNIKEDRVYGIQVIEYVHRYLGMLLDGNVMYQKMDWRVCRLLWEHACVMQERIRLVTGQLRTRYAYAENYGEAVKAADTARMLYAYYHMKYRESILQGVIKNVEIMLECEQRVLSHFIEDVGGVIR